METAVTGIISHDLNGIVIGWDVGAEKIFGYSHTETLGSPISRLIPPDLLEEKAETLRQLARMERVAPFETRRIRKDGQPVSVLLVFSPVPDFMGKVVAITKVVCEVTTRREAEPTPAKPFIKIGNDSVAQRPDQDFSLKRELYEQSGTNSPVYQFPQASSLLRLTNLQVLLEVLPNGVILVNGQGIIVLINTGAVRMFGYGQEEPLGRSIELLFPGARGDPRWRDPAQILASPLALSVEMGSEVTAHRKDGSQFPTQVTLSSIRTLESTFVLVTIVDVTERKSTQEKLKESDARFREFAENLKDLLWISDPRVPKLIYASPAYERLWGRPLSALYADFSQGIESIHADDCDRVRQNFFATVLKGNYDTEFRVVRPDGSIVWIRDRGFPIFDEHGELVRVTGIGEDITERKQAEEALQESEQKFRLMVECLPQLIWTCKPDGQCDFLNQRWSDYTGIPAAEQLGLNWLEQVQPDERAHLVQTWNTAVAIGADFHSEFHIRHHDGTYHRFHTDAVPLRDPEGRILKWFGSNTDVQETHELYEALQKSVTRLQVLTDASQAFADVSLDHQTMLELLARKMVEALGDNCFIFLLSDAGYLQGPIAVYDVDPERAELVRTVAESVPHHIDGPSLARMVMQSERPLLIPVVDQEWLRTAMKPGFNPVRDRLNPHSLIVIPICVQKRIIGLLYLFRCRREWAAFEEEDVKLAQDLADRAALAIANVRLYRDVQAELELRLRVEKSLRESEEYFHRLFDEAALPAIMLAPDGHFLKPNSAACRFFDVPEDMLLTQTFRDVTHPEDLAMTEEALAPLLSGAADSYQIEKRFVRSRGEVVWALVNCTVMRDIAGAPYRLLAQLQDITGRKQAEETLRKSEERFRATFEQVAMGIAHVSLDGRWLLVNQKFCDIVGYPREELLEQGFETLTHPDDLAADQTALQQLLADTKHSVSFEKRYIRKDGSPVWINITGSLMREVGGEPQYVISVIEDITRRRQAEEARRESEERFRGAFEHAPIGITLFNPEGRWLKVNSAFCEMVGYSEPELLERTFQSLTHQEDLKTDVEAYRQLGAGEVDSISLEKRYFHKAGHLVWVNVNTTIVRSSEGNPPYFISQVLNVTDRKQAEKDLRENQARLAGIISSAMDAIITVDEAQNILHFNLAAEKMFRYQEAEMIGRPLHRLLPERFRAAHREHVQRFGQTGVSRRAMGGLGAALHGVRADAEEFPIEASISQVVVEGKKTYTVILRDITERQRAVQEIQMLNAELEQRVQARTAELLAANKELEAFSYSVSHDLRAPLRNVSGFIELFTKSFGQQLTPGPQRYLTIITEETKRMGVLIDDLLAFSRIGRVELRKTTVNLTQLIHEVQMSLLLETQSRDITWHIGVLPEVYADRALLRQVVVNLVTNALKFTRTRAPAEIEIGIVPTPSGDQEVVVFVRDNGVGFDMQYIDKLFNVFQRLHRSDEFEGTGVGLANVQRIIHRHGGRVWAEAAVDQGATFFVALPHHYRDTK